MNLEDIVIYLSPLEALKLNEILKPASDIIEEEAIKENRPIDASEDLMIHTLSKTHIQIAEQIQHCDPRNIEQDRNSYYEEFQEEQDKQAENN